MIAENIIQTESKKLDMGQNLSVKLIVLIRKNFTIDGVNQVCDMTCYGKTIKEWAVSSAGEFPCEVVYYGLSDNVVDIIKPHLTNEQITIALYCETPLIRHSTLVELVNDFIYKNQKVRKFKRGYLFDTKYLKQAENVYAPEIGQEESEDFMPITNMFDFEQVLKIMKQRILNYHISNGVQIIDCNSTYIEAEVEIQKGAIIYPNNNLLGATFIEKGAIIYPNNVIKNSYVCENSKVVNSYLEGVKVKPNTEIKSFTNAEIMGRDNLSDKQNINND